jgi:hypothetical protein
MPTPPDLTHLAQRATSCPHWRWLPGMLTLQHGRVCGSGFLVIEGADELGSPFVDCADTVDDWPACLPDLSDPATLGCLLALVRESLGDPWIRVEPGSRGWYCIHSRPPSGGGIPGNGETEAEALVAALEAAP